MDSTANSSRSTTEIDEKITDEHESIPEEIREQVLDADEYRCQTKGCIGTQRGGTAQLVVQLLEGHSPADEEIDPESCTTRCRRCSRWVAKMPTSEDLRPILKERLNGVEITPTWAEILNYLDSNGPATTSEILEHVSLSSKPGVRSALYALLSLDIRKSEIDERIIVKDRINRTYGLPRQVPEEHDARGVIPIQPSERRTRILDEIAHRLDEAISDDVEDPSAIIARIVDRQPEQIRHLKRRAEAFDFPFEAWAADKYPKQGPATVIDAVSTIANCTDNVSRQLLSSAIIDVFEANDEAELAELLNNWAQSDGEYRKQSSLPEQPAEDERSHYIESETTQTQDQQTLDDRSTRNDTSETASTGNSDAADYDLSSLSVGESQQPESSAEEEI
jgi:hypothetical protein